VVDPFLQQALEESTEEVLEKMFFIQCLGEPPGNESQPDVVAHLTFEGDPSGELTLAVTASAARSVAADFLAAEEPDLSDQEIGEVVCELANMICGSVLSRVESSATFRLATPQIVVTPGTGPVESVPSDLTQRVEQSIVHAVEIGSGRMLVSINTETPGWSTAAR
jgi:CheY-specific phosphatase CheX